MSQGAESPRLMLANSNKEAFGLVYLAFTPDSSPGPRNISSGTSRFALGHECSPGQQALFSEDRDNACLEAGKSFWQRVRREPCRSAWWTEGGADHRVQSNDQGLLFQPCTERSRTPWCSGDTSTRGKTVTLVGGEGKRQKSHHHMRNPEGRLFCQSA